MLSFASFGATCSFDSLTGTLTVSGKGELTQTKVTDAVNLDGKRITDIKKVIIKSGITSIGNNAFSGCSKLTSITIPNRVTRIGDYAFSKCSSLSSITIPDSVKSIGNNAFRSCTKLTSIEIPNSVESIGDNAFSGCSSLIEITVDGTNSIYKDINGVLFTKDGTQLICYPAGKVGSSYKIPKSVKSIGNNVFQNCTALTSVIIPYSVKSIGNNVFQNCTALTSVIIPKSVKSIGNNVFYNCSNLKYVYYLGTKAQWGNLEKKMSSSDRAKLAKAKIHYNCKPKTLTVNKVWKDNSNSSLRSEPTFVLYIVYTGCTKSGESGESVEYTSTSGSQTFIVNSKNGNYAKQEEENGRYTVYEKMAERKYTQGKFSDNVDGDTNIWQYKITVFNHIIGSTYAVGEKPMEGYTSDAYVY